MKATDNAGHVSDNASQWVTVAEAAAALDKSERTIRRWANDGKIPVDRTTPVMTVDIAGHVSDSDQTTPVSDHTVTGAALDELTAKIERLEGEAQDLRAEIDQLTADNAGLEGETEALRAKIDRLATDNRDLEADNERLRDLLDQAQNERDYLRQAHAASLSTQQRLLEAQTGRRSWIERLLPWTREGGDD